MRRRNGRIPSDEMLITTTATLDGHPIDTYLGMVSGQAVVGTELYNTMFGVVRDISGGRSAAYEAQLSRAKHIAVEDMLDQARMLGADGVIGVDLDYATLPGTDGTMLMVSASGTAVHLAGRPARRSAPLAAERASELAVGGRP